MRYQRSDLGQPYYLVRLQVYKDGPPKSLLYGTGLAMRGDGEVRTWEVTQWTTT